MHNVYYFSYYYFLYYFFLIISNYGTAVNKVLYINHISNKLDELFILSKRHAPDIIALTETFLNKDVIDSAVSIENYSVVRKDRPAFGGGVMLFISNSIRFSRLVDIESDDFEVVWVTLRPMHLPRPLTVIIVAVVYCPPSYNSDKKRALADHILTSTDALTRKHPDAGIFIMGDFNSLDTSLFNRSLHLNQLVTKATRGSNILDKVFTNCQKLFRPPIIFALVGKSDHNCILIRPICLKRVVNNVRFVSSRRVSASAYSDIAAELDRVKWHDMYKMDDCQQQMDFFYCHVFQVLDKYAPFEGHIFKENDRPWVTSYFKNLIMERDLAFRKHNVVLYKKLRNKVNRVRKSLQTQFSLIMSKISSLAIHQIGGKTSRNYVDLVTRPLTPSTILRLAVCWLRKFNYLKLLITSLSLLLLILDRWTLTD